MTKYSEIGTWSEAKLDIVRKYGHAYSVIMSKRPYFRHAYIDAFAGPGTHLTKNTRQVVAGSPLNALAVDPPFEQYYFIDIENRKLAALRAAVGDRENVHMYRGDCNDLLLNDVFPRAGKEFRKALCLLDPYGLHLDWEVMETAGGLGGIEIFLNFPIMDIERNVLLRDPLKANAEQIARMTRFWGDDSWRAVAYGRYSELDAEYKLKTAAIALVNAFRERLRKVAGFEYVPEPVVMRMMGYRGPVLYYLFFASPNKTGAKIVGEIFDKYRPEPEPQLF